MKQLVNTPYIQEIVQKYRGKQSGAGGQRDYGHAIRKHLQQMQKKMEE